MKEVRKRKETIKFVPFSSFLPLLFQQTSGK
jgi:hypothetical protein